MMCYEVCETVFQIRDFHTRIAAVNKHGEDAYLRLSGVTKIQTGSEEFQVSVARPQASCLILFFLYFS